MSCHLVSHNFSVSCLVLPCLALPSLVPFHGLYLILHSPSLHPTDLNTDVNPGLLMCTTHRVLDRYKNAIGRMQHYWLVFACDKLGLTRYLLPSLTKKVSVRPFEHFQLISTLMQVP